MKNSVKYFLYAPALLSFVFLIAASFKVADKLFYTFKLHNPKDVKEFFKYTPDEVPFISSHRGGSRQGYPENCIATFEHTLQTTHSMIEFDPHYTKDSVLVVMHDPTLNRTSNGTGKIADYTFAELKKFRLKDENGTVTDYPIPTLDEVIEWGKGKTIMDMDMKEVPIEARVKEIEKHHAEASTIVMAYTIADAQKCYKLDKNINMEVMLNTVDKLKEFDKSGVPWANVFVFVSHQPVTDRTIFDEIHKRGAMAMEGTSQSYDTMYKKGAITLDELNNDYKKTFESGADIIEVNLGIEAGNALRDWQKTKLAGSSKAKFF